MIELTELSKRYHDRLAVDGLSFTVQPGRITGFLGPNGAGKTTTMRMILGLAAPTDGHATINGRPYRTLPEPLREVGSLLDARSFHGGRTAYRHVLALARSNGIGRRRVDEVLGMVGITDVAGQRAGGFSLGMGQRLGIAAALVGDPAVLILDEPVNGLDTEGIRWMRALLQRLAGEGRTVFLSSHVMSEMELVADHLVVIGRGRLIADTSTSDFIGRHSEVVTLVRTPQAGELRTILEARGARIDLDAHGAWRVTGTDAPTIGELARHHDISIHELTPQRSTLEDVYTQLTSSSVEYEGAAG